MFVVSAPRDQHERRVRWSYGVAAASATLAGILLVLPFDVAAPVALAWAIGCAIAVLVIAIRERAQHGFLLPWLAAIGVLFTLGMLIRGVHGELVDEIFPMPSPADIVHLPAYALFLATLVRVHMARSQRRNPDAWLDGIAVALASALAIWWWYYADFLETPLISTETKALNAPYDAILLASAVMLLRIGATPGTKPASYRLLGTASACLVLVDLAAGVSLAQGRGLALTTALSPLVSGTTVAAVLHPSIVELASSRPESELRMGPLRLIVLSAMLLSPLVVLSAPVGTSQLKRDVATVLAVVVVAVVAVRVVRLLTMHERRTQADRALTQATARLAQASSLDEIRRLIPEQLEIVVPATRPASMSRVSASGPFASVSVGAPFDEWFLHYDNRLISPWEERVIASLVAEARSIAIARDHETNQTSALLEREAALVVAASEKRFRSLVQNASDIFIVLDADGKTTYASDAIVRVLGYAPETLVGKQLNSIVHENDQEPAARHFMAVLNGTKAQEKHEFRAYTADGDVRLFEAIMTDMTDVPEVNGVVINGTDVTAERSLERDLKDAETIDPLTLLLNRKSFINEIDTALRRASISGAAVSIAIIDLDDFKTINDALGPVLADQALVETANRIRRAVRLGDVVARLSGDEFGVLMPDGYSSLESVAAIERVLAELQLPFELDRHPLSLKATAGLAIDVGGSDTASVLLREADTALGTAKRDAPGKAIMFEEEMGSAVTERLDLRTGFERALHNDEMRLVYQPILDISTGRIVSLEALARWTHPQRGEISPNIFIPIAEDSNTITPLGEWALRTACTQVNEWTRRGLSDFTVSVNMSGQTLIEDDVISRVRSILRETRVDPSRIIIEITETVLIDDTEFIADRISALRSLGVALAIDDFGTGYSSLSYLQRYEFDYLKIDRAFVRPLEAPENVKEREIVAAIIRLAKGLGATTIAEGIEGESEHLVLQTLNCDRAQGFLFHRPKEVAEVFEILCEDLALDVAA